MSPPNTKGPKINSQSAGKKKPENRKKTSGREIVREKIGRGRKSGDKGRLEANKGARENRELRALEAFRMRCAGATISQIAVALKCAPSTVHEAIELIRSTLRSESMDLAAQEREIALQQLDDAISTIIPHIRGEIRIETVKEGKNGPKIITVEEYDARMKACNSLTRLIDRKSKLLGLDAPLKVDVPQEPPKIPEVTRREAAEVLRKWGITFSPQRVCGGDADA